MITSSSPRGLLNKILVQAVSASYSTRNQRWLSSFLSLLPPILSWPCRTKTDLCQDLSNWKDLLVNSAESSDVLLPPSPPSPPPPPPTKATESWKGRPDNQSLSEVFVALFLFFLCYRYIYISPCLFLKLPERTVTGRDVRVNQPPQGSCSVYCLLVHWYCLRKGASNWHWINHQPQVKAGFGKLWWPPSKVSSKSSSSLPLLLLHPSRKGRKTNE